MSTKITMVVDDDIPEKLLKLAGGPRMMGKYISDMVGAMYQNDTGYAGNDVEVLQMIVGALSGRIKTQEGKLMGIDARLARLEAMQP